MNEYTFEDNEIEQLLNSNGPVSPEIERLIETSISFTNTPEMMAIAFPAKQIYKVLTQEQIDAFWENLTSIIYCYSRKELSSLLSPL